MCGDVIVFVMAGLVPAITSFLLQRQNVDARHKAGHDELCRVRRMRAVPYSTLPIFFTAAIRRALSASTNFANSGASI
ncbi:MAG: hypothetical protein QOD89_2323 [Bradyrhizobium sp.]|nr:hypothetical protein [Bradyrhizobium sp.]